MNIPYVYILMNKTTGKKYIGSKTSKNSHPDLFWVNYFTSSNMVKMFIKEYGKDDFIYRILKIHSNKTEALKHEMYLLDKIKNREDYLNLHSGFYINKSDGDMNEYFYMMHKVAKITGKFSVDNKTGIHALDNDRKREIASMGGKSAAVVNKKLNRAIFNEEVRKKQHQTLKSKQISAFYDPELRKEISSKGGKVGGFSKHYYENNGMSEYDMIRDQSNRGKKGGPKNKGFLWYNDGETSYKYTTNNQKLLPFDEFLQQHPQYSAGFISNKTKGRIWANDGSRNYMVTIDEFNELKLNKGRLGDKSKYDGHKNKKNK